MAPKRGKETPLELCTSALSLGNSIAVHILEYLSDSKNVRHGFTELAVDFLEASRALFPASAGLTSAANSGARLSVPAANELSDLLRLYLTNFTVLNQTVSKLLDAKGKQGFGKLGSGLRMMFADNYLEKVRLSLAQCQAAAKKNVTLSTWTLGGQGTQKTMGIGYTALAAILDRPDPTEMQLLGPTTSARDLPALPDLHSERQSPLPSDQHLRGYGSFKTADRDAVITPKPMDPVMHKRGSVSGAGYGSETSKTTMADALSSHRGMGTNGDAMSAVTGPSSISHIDELMYSHELDTVSLKEAVHIKYDPNTIPKCKPKRPMASISPSAKTALVVAVQEQNHEMIEHLLDHGVSPDNGMERNLLRLATFNQDINSLRLLLLYGADPNAIDREGLTPLYTATQASSFEAAHLLLKYGADPNLSCGPDEETPFSTSLDDIRIRFAQLYLKHGADPNIIMASEDTPFIKAMNKATPLILVESMLVYNADPNSKNGHGETALFRAINARRVDLITLLLDHGANPNLPGPKHMFWPAIHQPRVVELLLQRGADLKRAPGILELAVSTNSLEAVQLLLRHGADPDTKKDGIFTPLCTAIRDNREHLVDIILAAGANPNLAASEYPAFKCVTHRRMHLLPRLIDAGADLNSPRGIIETAVAHRNRDALRFLLTRKIDANARNAEGQTALTTAIRLHDLEAIEILLEHGADPGVRGQEWPVSLAVQHSDILGRLLPHISVSKIPKGALEMAVQADQLDSVKLLLNKGVDVEEKNGGVFSPLTTSIREDRKQIFRFLLDEAGADPNSPGEHLPIIKAIRRHRENDLSYITHLIEKGADINLMYRGWNAVLQTLDKGDTQTLKLLAKMGTPDLLARDEDGNTVLEYLRERGMKEEEQILIGPNSTPSPKMKEAFTQLRFFVSE